MVFWKDKKKGNEHNKNQQIGWRISTGNHKDKHRISTLCEWQNCEFFFRKQMIWGLQQGGSQRWEPVGPAVIHTRANTTCVEWRNECVGSVE